MNYTQNKKIEQVQETTLVVGVDIGSTKQYARAFDWRGIEVSRLFTFADCKEGYEDFLTWIRDLQSTKGKDNVIVGCEPTGHYWFGLRDFLESQEVQLVLVNPLHVKQTKELDDNSQTKNDQKDPKVIAKLVIDGRYSIPYIPHGVYADLRGLWGLRQALLKQQISLQNRFLRWFKIYFPEYLNVFGSYEAKSSMALLQVACMPQEILDLGPEAINNIWREQKMRAVGMKRATSLVNVAANSIGQTSDAISAKMEMRLLLAQKEVVDNSMNEVMAKIEELCAQLSETENMLKIKGIGLVTVAGFLAEVGDVRRFESSKQIIKLAGLSLRENSSGKHKGRTTISKRGRARLRKLLFNAAVPLVALNEEFKEIHNYYISRCENPLKKKQSIVAICCKLVRVFYAMIRSGKEYNAGQLRKDIHRPLLAA